MEFSRSIFSPWRVVDEAGDFGGPETLVKLILEHSINPIGVEMTGLGQGPVLPTVWPQP
jgi:hypothetical protein